RSPGEHVDVPAVSILCYEALCAWHYGEFASSRAKIAEAISLAKELEDTHGFEASVDKGTFTLWERPSNLPGKYLCCWKPRPLAGVDQPRQVGRLGWLNAMVCLKNA